MKHDKYSADSMTSKMTGGVIINTEVNIDEVLELENQQQQFQAVCLVCSINHRITSTITQTIKKISRHGPLTRYVKLQVAHAPGMPGTFSPAADYKGNR